MARIVVSEFVSLDGVMEAPAGEPGYRHTGWVGRLDDTVTLDLVDTQPLASGTVILTYRR